METTQAEDKLGINAMVMEMRQSVASANLTVQAFYSGADVRVYERIGNYAVALTWEVDGVGKASITISYELNFDEATNRPYLKPLVTVSYSSGHGGAYEAVAFAALLTKVASAAQLALGVMEGRTTALRSTNG
jgi:hypothetical protein